MIVKWDSAHDCRGGRQLEQDEAYLPHRCDEWVIGGPDQVKQLILDLQDALRTMLISSVKSNA